MKTAVLRAPLALCLALLTVFMAVPQQAKAEDPAIVGVWDCVSETPDGGEYAFTLTVKQQDGKYVVTAGTDEGTMPIGDFTVEGDDASFKATVGDQDYTVKIKVAGTSFTGKWSGGEQSGAIKGTKHA